MNNKQRVKHQTQKLSKQDETYLRETIKKIQLDNTPNITTKLITLHGRYVLSSTCVKTK